MKKLFKIVLIAIVLLVLMGLEGLIEDLISYRQYYKAAEAYLEQIYRDFPVSDVSAETDAFIPYQKAAERLQKIN